MKTVILLVALETDCYRRRVRIEALEQRRLLAADAFQIFGTDGDDVMSINAGPYGAQVTLNGATQSFTYDDANGIEVLGGGGNDTIDIVAHDVGDVTVRGGGGNDDLLIHDSGHTGYYFGDAGDDNLRVYRSSWTQRIFSGGAGNDTVDFSGFVNEWFPVTVTLDNVANDGSPTELSSGMDPGPDNVLDDVERIIGTPGPDTMVGSDHDEIFIARGGDDIVSGGGGNDLIQAGAGNDTLSGGDDADTLNAGSGDDSIDSGSSDTVIDPASAPVSEGELRVNGTSGDDVIKLTYDSLDDSITVNINGTLSVADARDISHIRIVGGAGNDYIRAETGVDSTILGDDTVSAGGNDTIISGWSNDQIYGGGGNDYLMGRGGLDSLYGEAGDDTLVGGADDDSLDGGDGNNVLIAGDADVPAEPAPVAPTDSTLPSSPSMTVALARKALRITGTVGDDQILLRRRASKAGMLEVIVNGVKSSYRFASLKQVIVDANAGNDVITFDASLNGNRFDARIYGGAGDDNITGSANADRICGGDGNDTVNAGGGNDSVYGDAGNDRLYGGDGTDYLCSGLGKDILRGGAGRDKLAVVSKQRADLRNNSGDRIVQELL